MNHVAVKAENLSKKFNVYQKPYDRLKEWLTLGAMKTHEEFWALQNINFQLNKGESLGIIGPNGAGKSTMLKVLTGSLVPTAGTVQINGRVVSLLELGTGFHPELTGLQNIYHSTSLLGFEPSYVESKLDEIIAFSGIGEFLDRPVKTYSSGMYVRLAFSLFANLEPDVYIVDEALAVGDVFFQQKCFAKMEEMRKQGVSLILVSHDPAPIINYCDQVIIVEEGRITHSGNPSEMIEIYQAQEYGKRSLDSKYEIRVQDGKLSYGNYACEILKVNITSSDTGLQKETFFPGDGVSLDVYIQCKDGLAVDEPLNIGIQIKNRFGAVVYGTNTYWHKLMIIGDQPETIIKCSFITEFNLGSGEYNVSVAVAESKQHPERIYHWMENTLQFTIEESANQTFGGQVFLPMQIKHGKLQKGDIQ